LSTRHTTRTTHTTHTTRHTPPHTLGVGGCTGVVELAGAFKEAGDQVDVHAGHPQQQVVHVSAAVHHVQLLRQPSTNCTPKPSACACAVGECVWWCVSCGGRLGQILSEGGRVTGWAASTGGGEGLGGGSDAPQLQHALGIALEGHGIEDHHLRPARLARRLFPRAAIIARHRTRTRTRTPCVKTRTNTTRHTHVKRVALRTCWGRGRGRDSAAQSRPWSRTCGTHRTHRTHRAFVRSHEN
jgi:hypothetical protein